MFIRLAEERIRTNALQNLSGKDAQALTQLWDEIYSAFQAWKQERGSRNPRPLRGLLNCEPMPLFKNAEPWECVDSEWPNPITLALNLRREDYAPFKAMPRPQFFWTRNWGK